jgi:hypothetical protein
MMEKYELLDLLDDIRSIEHMIEVHSSNPDNISQFMIRQYKTLRRKNIKLFNTITNGKKISEY